MRTPVIVYVLLASLVLLNAGTLLYLWHGRPHPHIPPHGSIVPPGPHPPAFDQVLGFEGAQLDQFRQLQEQHHYIKDSLDLQTGLLRSAMLGRIILGDSVAAYAYADSIGMNRTAGEAEVVRFFSGIRNICTDSQVSGFDSILKDLQGKLSAPHQP